MENRTGRTIGLILANASSSFTTAFMDLFQQELYQKDYKLVIGLTNHDLEKERFASRTITIPVTVDSVIKLYTNKVRKKKK